MYENKAFDLNITKKVHFVGIGGISMSGLAEILLNKGCQVSGSDLKSSKMTDRLEKMGIKFFAGHRAENIENPDLVVYTAAVNHENPELIRATEKNIPMIDRASLLGEVMRTYRHTLAVSGTHGKTTTTSMITEIMLESGTDPTVHIGGELSSIGGNTRIGGSRYFIAEACEYVESFLKFYPYLAVVLNIEADHLDYFKNIEHIKDSFRKFLSNIPKEGYIVACWDDLNTISAVQDMDTNIVSYGINSETAMWRARNIKFNSLGFAEYTLVYNNKELDTISLNVPGLHNVSNSLAAIASCYLLGCPLDSIRKGISNFRGTKRRFEFKGEINGIKVIDDYAHHPTEIRATLRAAKNAGSSRIWCVFQPHTYSRTKALLDDFSESFKDADRLILSDIYAAREKDPGDINSGILCNKINEKENGKALYLRGFDEIVAHLKQNASNGDIIITMGAGDIYKAGEMFLTAL